MIIQKQYTHMTYSEAVDFVNGNFISFQSAGRAAYHEGLEAITAMCRAMGDPQGDYLTIHIAGTNGKGSVAHMLASVLQAAGYRTGLYTSPHMHDFRERIRVDGVPVSEDGVAAFLTEYGGLVREYGLTYFEMTTAMAFKWFADSGVEVAVVETGLGGRLDATNIITPVLSVITNIGLDHCDILGSTIARIAAEKSGIIKERVPVVVGESDPGSAQVFITRAAECSSPIIFADLTYDCMGHEYRDGLDYYTLRRTDTGTVQEIGTDLRGGFQQKNLITARTAVSALRRRTPLSISSHDLREGFGSVAVSTGLRGRWQVVSRSPLTVADGGHNPHAMAAIVEQLSRSQYDRLYMVMGFSADKALDTILAMLPSDAHYIFTQADSPRAMPAARLADEAAAHGLEGEAVENPHAALERAQALATQRDMIFIGGSFYLVGELI